MGTHTIRMHTQNITLCTHKHTETYTHNMCTITNNMSEYSTQAPTHLQTYAPTPLHALHKYITWTQYTQHIYDMLAQPLHKLNIYNTLHNTTHNTHLTNTQHTHNTHSMYIVHTQTQQQAHNMSTTYKNTTQTHNVINTSVAINHPAIKAYKFKMRTKKTLNKTCH